MIQYSSNEGDLVCDFFLGSFSTAKVAKGLNRYATGFEISKNSFNYQIKEFEKLKTGYLQSQIRKPPKNLLVNSGKSLTADEKKKINAEFKKIKARGLSKKQAIEDISKKYGRGYWSVLKIIDGTTNKSLKK